jgi:FtsP/CotA-like multicopper oxidase with cupredoxin domain
VLIALNPEESWDYSIEIPEDHFIGMDWYHPHLHGTVNVQVASGAAGQLMILAPHDLPDLDKFDPKEEPFHTFAINTFGIQQESRPGSPDDPLNTADSSVVVPAGTPLEPLGTEDGETVYQLSDAPFMGYNAKPAIYDPAKPLGNPPPNQTFYYGGGPLAEPSENVIHTVNGQYNPTLEITTGEWNLFSFNNMSSNAFHVIQVVKDTGTELVPQEVTLVALDGDAVGVVASNRAETDELYHVRQITYDIKPYLTGTNLYFVVTI